MDIYHRKSRWRLITIIAGLLVVLASLWYTNYLSRKLADEEQKRVEIWAQSIQSIRAPIEEGCMNCLDCQDFTLPSLIQEYNTTIPILLVNRRGGIDDALNFNTRDSLKLIAELHEMVNNGQQPIQAADQLIYFKESNLLQQLRYYPFLQFLLIGAFVAIGYLALTSAKRSEQNRLWVGMAKETAHQLGTPLTAIIAWVEHMKSIREDDPEIMEIAYELEQDVDKLRLVTDRFSKIGSRPELEPADLYKELNTSYEYMRKRAPRKVEILFPDSNKELPILLNTSLFNWVIENLLRNALDSMDGKGKIEIYVINEREWVTIDISDTGKGIPSGKFRTIFEPGYSTKKRGWGLGLSLAKRIIEDYHKGKIFVKQSELNKGSTFSIRLKKSPEF